MTAALSESGQVLEGASSSQQDAVVMTALVHHANDAEAELKTQAMGRRWAQCQLLKIVLQASEAKAVVNYSGMEEAAHVKIRDRRQSTIEHQNRVHLNQRGKTTWRRAHRKERSTSEIDGKEKGAGSKPRKKYLTSDNRTPKSSALESKGKNYMD